MKTLILNGSPRPNGDTAFLLSKLKNNLDHEVVEISAYYDGIAPCVDCRACTAQKGCAVNDKMSLIYNDDFDNIVVASPIYFSTFTPPLLSIVSRLQAHYCAKRFLKDEFMLKRKKAALILVGGGDGSPTEAVRLSRWFFGKLNAVIYEKHTVMSLNTDTIAAKLDQDAIDGVAHIASYFNGADDTASVTL